MDIEYNKSEKNLIHGISLLMAIRMLGVSLIIPIFSIYATKIQGSTGTLAGLAFGIFSISQIIFLIPLGKLSDRWGRKETTLLGFIIYTLGTVLTGLSSNIYYLIISRFIAGAGAVSGVIMAWLTDGISLEKRNSSIAYVGVSIRVLWALGLPLSPIIYHELGAPYVFYISAAITLIAILYIFNLKNNYGHHEPAVEYKNDSSIKIYMNGDLVRLNIIGFIGSFSFAGIFFVMPLLMTNEIEIIDMTKILALMVIIGTLFMYLFAKKADKQGTIKISLIGFSLELVALIIPILWLNLYSLIASFIIFYSGSSILLPLLPAAVSRFPGSNIKGKVMSAFYTSRSLGLGLGGLLGGIIRDKFPPQYFFCLLIILVIIAIISIIGYKDFKEQ